MQSKLQNAKFFYRIAFYVWPDKKEFRAMKNVIMIYIYKNEEELYDDTTMLLIIYIFSNKSINCHHDTT